MTDLKLAAQRALNLMDLTTLNDDDTDQKVIDLCRKAKSPAGLTAAVCIYPRFIPIARKTLREIGAADVRIATVTNFPHGNDDIEIAVAETRAAVAYGADEVDVVFPYRAFMAGSEQVGFDLVKDTSVLVAAYDDAAGVTAAFNINLLTRMNRELGADFDLSGFRHLARWNDVDQRIEMHLQSLSPQTVEVAGQLFTFAEGETIHTENACKFTLPGIERLAASAGWSVERAWRSDEPAFAVVLLRAA